jgi:hypothetical protein
VPLVIFKREKEIARKLEFEGLWVADQPGDDDIKAHWDKLDNMGFLIDLRHTEPLLSQMTNQSAFIELL